MVGLSAVIALPLALLAAEPSEYERAFRDAEAKHRPLLVLVGATWCPSCQTMKRTVLPRLVTRGELATVSFATVDADAEADLAGQLLRGNSVPQLIAFSRKPGGKWQREQITGLASDAQVQGLIARALKVQRGAADATPASAAGE